MNDHNGTVVVNDRHRAPGQGRGRRGWIGSSLLLVVVLLIAAALGGWKYASLQKSKADSAHQPEPIEMVTLATAKEREHRRTTVSIGTILALRSISLRNELPGTVREVSLPPGEIVEAGTLLVALDVSVEEAELKAQEAQVALAENLLARTERLVQTRASSEMDLERAVSERDVGLAQIARIKAIIGRKTIRAPFRARVGLADIHPGQYLEEGTHLTTLQSVDEAVHVDFSVPQQVAASLDEQTSVAVFIGNRESPIPARVIAVDARINPETRNAMIRARIEGATNPPVPGASVRVRTPYGPTVRAVSIPVSALRKGPSGDHVFVVSAGKDSKLRAHLRPVQSGAMIGDEMLILEGLVPGEQVAATGSFKLRDSVLVALAGGAKQEARQTSSK